LARDLSGGERTRTSLACALAGGPDVLVLDEPTVGLDPVLRRDLWTLFRRLADEGRCLLVSSHVMDEASRCDRLLLLHQGRILAETTPDDLLPRTGAADADGAFLNLIDAANHGQDIPWVPPAPQDRYTGRHEDGP
jgi:ABC-2 type transport system ATP-binding protein